MTHPMKGNLAASRRVAAGMGTAIALGLLAVLAAPAEAGVATVVSAAGVHNDYWRGSYYTWQPGNATSVGISGLDCFGGCFWGGDKTFNELVLPAVSGNIVNATFYLDVTGGSGDAWVNANNWGGLTGDANADQSLFSWQFNNSGARVQTNGATGWVGVDVTAQVQGLYNSGLSWTAFSIDPVPWSTSLSYEGAGSGLAPYLVVTTDAAEVPEPVSFATFGLGALGLGALRRRRTRPG